MRAPVFIFVLLAACGGDGKKVSTTPAKSTPTAEGAPDPAAVERTQAQLRAILAAAKKWLASHPDGVCPSISQLKADGALDPLASDNDAWGKPFAIACTDSEVKISSIGPDGVARSADDTYEKADVAPPVVHSGPPARTDLPPLPTASPDVVPPSPAEAAMTKLRPMLRACYNRALREDPTVQGKLALTIVIRPDGTVKSAKMTRGKSDIASPVLAQCILSSIAKASFGPTGQKDDVTIEIP